jgi:SAM-dependent methyltransferase
MFNRRKKIAPGSVIEVEPYTALAQIYDQVMNHVDYSHWARYLLKLAQLHGMSPKMVLDISCGTGSLCREFSDKGMDVLACDASLPMLRIAVRKATPAAGAIRYWCAEMAQVVLNRPVDFVLSSYDSMNYLQQAGDWHAALLQTHALLRPGGLFIFDISTLRNSVEIFADYVHQEEFKEGSYRRESFFDQESKLQYNNFEIELTGHPDCLYKEVHVQRIRSLAEVDELIAHSPFTLLGCYADFSVHPGSEKADRVHYILQKARK